MLKKKAVLQLNIQNHYNSIFFIISISFHLTLIYESLKQYQVFQFVFNTIKSHRPMEQLKQKIPKLNPGRQVLWQ